MAVMPQVLRRRGQFDLPSVAPKLAISLSAVVSLVLVGTALLPRQYSTPVTSAPIASEFARFEALTLRAIEASCSSAGLVVLAPSDVVSVDLAGPLQHLSCEVVRPTVVTPLRTIDTDGVFVVESTYPTGRMPSEPQLAEVARAQARAAGITAPLQPLGRSATEHFLVSEYRW